MRLKALKLKNFRGYRDEIEIPFEPDLTAFIGRNDVGKSSILDALAIFFDSPLVKFERSDRCVHTTDPIVRIGCVFDDLPETITLDATSRTSLKDEYLLNENGYLEIHKIFDCSQKNPKPKIVALALHPTADGYSNLLYLKHEELKRRLRELGIPTDNVDLRSNPSMRRAIWRSCPDLHLQLQEIDLTKEDAKSIWDQLQKHMPIFALFRADRPSTDEDAEIQDPMKVAIRQAVSEMAEELKDVEDKVRSAAMSVAERTLRKLWELQPALAKELNPDFRAEPKWDTIFKLTLNTEDNIPVNKRGSGVRRLILLAFFRAETERRREEEDNRPVIYAIEEPETSQHPSSQRAIIEALKELASTDDCQVILTTHVPGLAEEIGINNLRYVRVTDDGSRVVELGSDDVFARIADELGVMPDNRVRVIVCVEGPNDVVFLKHMARIIKEAGYEEGIDLEPPEVVLIHLGGATLRDWVNAHYLKPLRLPEIHIYDRGNDKPPKYEHAVRTVNNRGDGSQAFLTKKAEAENYLHPAAIQRVLGVTVEITDDNDVPMEVAKAIYEASGGSIPWDELPAEKKEKRESKVKKRLNNDVAAAMTIEMLEERGALEEIRTWLRAIKQHLRSPMTPTATMIPS